VNTRNNAPGDRWNVISRDRNPAFPDIDTTRPDGGGKELLLENEGRTLNWLMDHDGVPLMRFDRDAEDETITQVMIRDNADGSAWRELFRVDAMTTFWVTEITEDARFAHALSSRDRDRAAVVRVDLETGAEEVLAEDPDLDLFRSYSLAPFDGETDLVKRHSNGAEPIALTPRGEVLKRLILEQGRPIEIDNLRSYGDGRFVTATLSPQARSYIYVLFDLKEETTRVLGEFSFRRKHLDKLVPTEEVSIPARDGLDIPALLLQPKGVAGPVPMLVEVHGGPASHVSWEYNHFRQFLVNRGYAVLSVNFRGSTGFGRAFQAEGFGEYGRAMQTDIYDAAAGAGSDGFPERGAVAVEGGCYGGQAAGKDACGGSAPFAPASVERVALERALRVRHPRVAWGAIEVRLGATA